MSEGVTVSVPEGVTVSVFVVALPSSGWSLTIFGQTQTNPATPSATRTDAKIAALEFTESDKALTLRSEPSWDYFHVVMPMQQT